MTRGNQREQARKAAEKRAAKATPKGDKSGLSASQRRERDARVMREKQEVSFPWSFSVVSKAHWSALVLFRPDDLFVENWDVLLFLLFVC